MDIKINQSQKLMQHISPEYLQTLNILQMSSIELTEYINSAIIENPVLDMDSSGSLSVTSDLLASVSWLSKYPMLRSSFSDDTDGKKYMESLPSKSHETLQTYLLEQIRPGALPSEIEEAVRIIVYELNNNGYLEEAPEEYAARYNLPVKTAVTAVSFIKTLEPAGVGARNLSEQLTLQLERAGSYPLSRTIVQAHLSDMANGNFNKISKNTGASREDILEACEVIRALDPRPCAAFGRYESAIHMTPDVIIDTENDRLKVIDLKNTGPAVCLNTFYCQMLETSSDPALTDYLNKKISAAMKLISDIENRQSSIVSCAKSIAERQQKFFFTDSNDLAPLKYSDIAADTGVYESTVSRIVRRKYILCSKGLFSFKHFFSKSITNTSGEDISVQRIKASIAKIIKSEDQKAPLSDQAIADRLKEQSIIVARRTVAKYREELGIPSTKIRRSR